MTETEKAFKKNLVKLRESKGLSRYNISTILKIDYSYYNRLENMDKSTSPSFELLEKIANYYELRVADLFSEEIFLPKEVVEKWKTQSLEYAVVFINTVFLDVIQDGKKVKKSIHIAIAIKMNGRKEIIGACIGEKNENTEYWKGILKEFQNQGIENIMVVSTYQLPGFREALTTIFPKAKLCCNILEKVKQTVQYVKYRDAIPFKKDLKNIYTSPSIVEAQKELAVLKRKWENEYPEAVKIWTNDLEELFMFFTYPEEIRKLLYKTRYIEMFETQLKQAVKREFRNDDELLDQVFSEIGDVTERWSGQSGSGVIWNWANAYQKLIDLEMM